MDKIEKLSNEEVNLISFGNYLLTRYGVKVYSNDGYNIPLYIREVSHADLSNWKEEEIKAIEAYKEYELSQESESKSESAHKSSIITGDIIQYPESC